MKLVVQIIGGPSVTTHSIRSLSQVEESMFNVGIDVIKFTCADTGIVYSVPATQCFAMEYPEPVSH